LPFSATFVAVSGDNLSPFNCRRFRQLLSPVWTGFNKARSNQWLKCKVGGQELYVVWGTYH